MEVVSYGDRVLFSVSPSLPARVTALVPYELLLRGSKTTFVKINNTSRKDYVSSVLTCASYTKDRNLYFFFRQETMNQWHFASIYKGDPSLARVADTIKQ